VISRLIVLHVKEKEIEKSKNTYHKTRTNKQTNKQNKKKY